MIPGRTHLWRHDKVVTFEGALQVEDFTQSTMLKYLYHPTVWMSGPDTNYGFFDQTERFDIFFRHQHPSQMPEEFRLSLLIMGVTL